jgi:DNA primase large subunit
VGGLPQDGKRILFTHCELEAYLSNYLELELTETVGRIQQETGAAFARPIWSKVERHGHRYRLSHRRAVQEALEARAPGKKTITTADITEALAYRDNFHYLFEEGSEDGEDFDAQMLEQYVLPFMANMLDGEFLDHPEWEQEPLLHKRYTAIELSDNDEPLPRSYSELLRYAQERWPPCAARIVASCEGKNHLKYEMRLKMAALIRKFGHSEAAGYHLWTVLFSETEVAQQAKVPFLETEQGQVIRNDYHYNRTEKLGIGCESMRAVNLCPYATSPLVDIEECQQHCTAELSRKTSFPLKYPLHSPVEYKSLYAKYGRAKTQA